MPNCSAAALFRSAVGQNRFWYNVPRGNGSERYANRCQAGCRDGADINLVPYHERNTAEPECDADPLHGCKRLVHPARRYECSQEWLHSKDEGGDACRHSQILRVMAATQIDGVHQESGDQHMLEFRAVWPCRAQQRDDGYQQAQSGQKAQRKEGEWGSVLNGRFACKIARSPGDDKVPRK